MIGDVFSRFLPKASIFFTTDLHEKLKSTYLRPTLSSRAVTKLAQTLLERFFRDAEGNTEYKVDVEFVCHEVRTTFEKAEPALQYLESRGLIKMEGFDSAYMTEFGIKSVVDDTPVAKLPKKEIIWDSNPQPQNKTPASEQAAAEKTKPEPAIEREPTPQDAAAVLSEPPPRPTTPQLTIHTEGENDYETIDLGEVCCLGRLETSDYSLKDPRASKRHAEIKYAGHCYLVEDLGSANGTMLNGEYIQHQALAHGDEIVIGRTIICFTCPDPLPAMGAAAIKSRDPEFPAIDAESAKNEFHSQQTSAARAQDPLFPEAEFEAEPEMPQMMARPEAFEDGPTVARPEVSEAMLKSMALEDLEDDHSDGDGEELATIAAPPMLEKAQAHPLEENVKTAQSTPTAAAPGPAENSTSPGIDLFEQLGVTGESAIKAEAAPVLSSRFYRILQILQERLNQLDGPEKDTLIAALNVLAGSPTLQSLVSDLDDI